MANLGRKYDYESDENESEEEECDTANNTSRCACGKKCLTAIISCIWSALWIALRIITDPLLRRGVATILWKAGEDLLRNPGLVAWLSTAAATLFQYVDISTILKIIRFISGAEQQ